MKYKLKWEQLLTIDGKKVWIPFENVMEIEAEASSVRRNIDSHSDYRLLAFDLVP